MKDETRLNREAEERGETTQEETPPVINAMPSPDMGSASEVNASRFITDDTDRPKADNRMPPPSAPTLETPSGENVASNNTPNVSPPPSKGKRGRKPMTDEQKLAAKQEREAFRAMRAGKAPPDFSSLNKGGMSGTVPGRPARDYYLEACNLFFPASFMAAKFLGDHWGIPLEEREINGVVQKCIEPTDEQKQYLANMARWLEYEQFPELNARWGFIVSSIGYATPRIKTDPTPERILKAWEWIRVKILRRTPNPDAPK